MMGLMEIIVSGSSPASGDCFHAYGINGNELADFHKPVSA